MHTSVLRTEMFEVTIAGKPASVAELLDWGPLDRLGVVVTSPFGGMGASLLVQLAIVCFYDWAGGKRRAQPINPEIYCFHVGVRYGNHGAYDFWPARKEMLVGNDHVEVLNAINDRGITHLVVPEGPAQKVTHHYKEPETAMDRIKRCFVYDAEGAVRDADVIIRGRGVRPLENSLKTLWPEAMLRSLQERKVPPLQKPDIERTVRGYRERADEVRPQDRLSQEKRFATAKNAGELTESYRRVSVDYAIDRLCAPPLPGEETARAEAVA